MKAIVADIKEGEKVKIYGRPELGYGEVFRITERQGKSYADVVFQRDGQRVLETYPENMLEPVADILEVTRRESRINLLTFF